MADRIRVMDFEATGLWEDKVAPALCEIGWCDVVVEDGRAAVVEDSLTSTLVNPGRPMPPAARAIHHISDAMLTDAPSIDRGLMALRGDDGALFFAAHNADYEMRFFNPPGSIWIDTWKVALRLFTEKNCERHTNQYLRYFLGIALPHEERSHPPHRAGPDAYVTAHLLAHMVNLGKATLVEMAEWSEQYAVFPFVPFGGHFGKPWLEVPTGYLEWMTKQADMSEDFKANARMHLRRRGVR